MPTVAAILIELKEPAMETLLETVTLTTETLLKLPYPAVTVSVLRSPKTEPEPPVNVTQVCNRSTYKRCYEGPSPYERQSAAGNGLKTSELCSNSTR